MPSSSDSDDNKHNQKGFKISSKGIPVRWDGEDWIFYKQAMLNAFEESLLDEIALGVETEGSSVEEKNDFKKKQAKVKLLIMGSLSKRLAKQVMSKKTGTAMWAELVSIYDGKSNAAMKAQKVYRLNGELHRTHLRANGDVRSHLYKMFGVKEQLEELDAPVPDLQMVDMLLRSLPNQTCYDELRQKVFFSEDMSKYTPEMIRELILTAESRSRDWDNHAFGNNMGKKTQRGSSKSQQKSKQPGRGNISKKKTSNAGIECFNCGSKGHYRADCPEVECYKCGGKGHYKSNCPDLLTEEKPGSRKSAQAKYVRSSNDQKVVEQPVGEQDHMQKREVVIGEVVKRVAKDYDPSQWYFDTGTNAHIVASREYFTSLQSMDDSDWNPNISGFTDGVVAQAEGFGTILIATLIDEQMVFVFLEDVLYVPDAGCNLFSPGQALDQGFEMSWDQDTRLLGMSKDGTEVISTAYGQRLWVFDVHNIGSTKSKGCKVAVKKQVIANFTVTDGVADIELWHTRLGHTCPEYIRLMVDHSMAKGMMLQKRGKVDCADCHFGKQRRKTFRKALDRVITRVNDMVFSDLLIPGVHNGTQYSAVLVVMDGFSRFVTIYILKSKTEEEVNGHMKEYIAWAERQQGRKVDRVVSRRWCEEESRGELDDTNGPVRQVLTDKGREFCNHAMESWYAEKGIIHTKVGPKSSQLNLVERNHQTLIGMVKTMMHDSGFPKSFWVQALRTAVYIKNRVFCKGAGRTPYETLYGARPDLHHIRTFGSLVYCHTPLAKRTKLSVNCRVGFLLGYQEDVVGCQVYFPTEHKKGFVADVKINEKIKYKDRYGSAFKSKVDKWLQTFDDYVRDGDFDVGEEDEEDDSSQQAVHDMKSVRSEGSGDVEMEKVAPSDDLDDEAQQLSDDILVNSKLSNVAEAGSDQSSELNAEDQHLWNGILRNSSLPSYGSDVAFVQTQGGDDADIDEHLENASDNGSAEFSTEGKVDADGASNSAQQETEDELCDYDDLESEIESVYPDDVVNLVTAEDSESGSDAEADYSCIFDPGDANEAGDDLSAETMIGRRRPLDEGAKRAREPKRAKLETKRQKVEPPARRPGLREAHERRPPDRFEDFAVTSAFRALHVDRRGNSGIRASSLKIPRTYREATRSKYAREWKAAMDEEIQALKDKEVLHMIPRTEMPAGQKAIKTMWVFDIKVDHLGYVVRFRARIVARGDKQRKGIDYKETFSPVARMATFRLFIAVCVLLQLTIYQGDVNTAYLNAVLEIKQYLEELEGYPCEEDGMVYMITKALYGLKQSGREWNSEVNAWFIRYGFKQCSTEPCLYYFDHDGVFALVLLYVDDILCATAIEEFKNNMFSALNEDYGLKDQGLLSTYLGVEVEQNDSSLKIHQTGYCEQVIEKYDFSDAHASRIPMETKLRLTMKDTDSSQRKQELGNGKTFPYRELVGSLMYLATCTRPDIAYVVGQLSRFVQHPSQQHIGAAKRVLRYLVGTNSMGIVYSRTNMGSVTNELVIDGFCDSDWGNDPDTRKSVTGYVHCVAGGAISWASKRQTIVAQSTAEAEYVAACESCMEGQGLRNMLIEVFPKLTTKVRLGIDNQAAFVMATNPTFSRRTRHIELRWHYVRDQVTKKTVTLYKVKTDVNASDLLTKPLSSERLEKLSKMIGLAKEHLTEVTYYFGGGVLECVSTT